MKITQSIRRFLSSARTDVPAGFVVFLVAVPLCLGIAQASGAPLLAGLIAGVIGGIVVAALSGSQLSVSGPAAGLAVIVAAGIGELGLRGFLLATVIAGALQLAMGLLRLGGIAHFFPSSVIKGMLAAIGVLLILKQLPHAVGYDRDPEGDLSLWQQDGSNTFSALVDAAQAFAPAAVIVSLLSVAAMLLWPKLQRGPVTKLVPPALVAVALGAIVVTAITSAWPSTVRPDQLVALPRFDSWADIAAAIVLPDFSRVLDPAVWRVGVTLALVASLETLLCLEAVDRIDPHRRISPPNRELIAQGAGNLLSGLIGGLPITSVIVRSSANVQAGAQTRLSAMTHGVLLLAGVLLFAPLLNRVPLAALAVVLLFVGYKLTPPSLWRHMWRAGMGQFAPFSITVISIVATDLLTGTLIGLVVGLFVMVRNQQKNAVAVLTTPERHVITFHKDMTFLQKARIKDVLRAIEDGAEVRIDRRAVDYVDEDIEELLREFAAEAPHRAIKLTLLARAHGASAVDGLRAA